MKSLLLISALLICGLHAQEYLQFIAESGSWNNASNWADGKIPRLNDTAYVASPGHHTYIYIDEPAECYQFYSFTATSLIIRSSFDAIGGIGLDGGYFSEYLHATVDAPVNLPVTASLIWIQALTVTKGLIAGVESSEPVITLTNLTIDGEIAQFMNSHIRTEYITISAGATVNLVNGSTLVAKNELKVEGQVAIYTDNHLVSSLTVPEIRVSERDGTDLTIATSTTADSVHVAGTSTITLSGPLTTGNFTGPNATVVINTWGTLIAPHVIARYLSINGQGFVGVNRFELGDLELLSENAKILVSGDSKVGEILFQSGIVASDVVQIITADSVVLSTNGQKVVDAAQIQAAIVTDQCGDDCNFLSQNGGNITTI